MEDNPVYTLLARHVGTHGEKAALLCDGRSVSYGELYLQIATYAALLQASGLMPGERTLISLPDSPEFVYAFLGSILAGFVPVPCSDLLDQEALAFLLNDCHAAALFGRSGSGAAAARSPGLKHTFLVDSQEFCQQSSLAPAHCPASPLADDATCFMLYTSGSTGTPKGIAHRGGMLLPAADYFGRDILRITSNDVLFSVSKMHFGFGLLNSIVHGLGAGGTVVLLPAQPALPVLRTVIANCRPTLLFAVPAIFTLLLGGASQLFSTGSLRLCVSSGETLQGALFQDWLERTGVEIIDSVGATETFHAFIASRPGKVVGGASGRVIPPWEARIVDEAGYEVASGLPGYLEVQDPAMVRPSEANNRAPAEEWLRTGDVFQVRDGLFTYVGRTDDMFKCAGNWVSPLPIESTLRLHPAVEDCAVRSRRILGATRPEAHIVLEQGFQESSPLEQDLFTFLRSRLPDYLCPVQFIFHRELPRTVTGKIRRGLLGRHRDTPK